PPTRPAPEAAGYGCEARLRGLDRAMSDYSLKPHQSKASLQYRAVFIIFARPLRSGGDETRLRGAHRTIPGGAFERNQPSAPVLRRYLGILVKRPLCESRITKWLVS
ncbi:MAG: hypothetical protein RMJ55_17685, partial [Roseiflexaceae bacterium]|nr:hypothetical protein [Roseiflexaceae bacterium]